MTACPSCSTFAHGCWSRTYPRLHFGRHSYRWSLECTSGCPLLAEAPTFDEYDGPVPFGRTPELMPQRIRSSEECQAELERWWEDKASAYDTREWSEEKREAWGRP